MVMMFRLCLLFFIFTSLVYTQSIGEKCKSKKTGNIGKCKVLNQCETAIKGLKQRPKIRPTLCDFDVSPVVVCCEEKPAKQNPGVMSRQKCKEYSQYIYRRVESPTAMIGDDDIIINDCGHKVETLIVGGEPASRQEFTHMAAIGFDNPGGVQWMCGGTLISDEYILTAAHCLKSRDLGVAKYVRIGVTNLLDTSKYRQDFNITERIPHPEYKSSSTYHDIALLKLHRRAKLNSFAIPACLNTGTYKAQKAIATGWGALQHEGETSPDLQKVTLDLFDHSYCSRLHPVTKHSRSGLNEQMQMCAGSLTEEKDSCQGDSGGPLQIYHIGDKIKCMYDIIGITSFGKGCGLTAGVYIRVVHYIQWIEDIVWPQ